MKNLTVLKILIIVLIFNSNNVYSQFDDGNVYYVKGFSLDYSGIEKNNISEIKFLSDSLIRIKSNIDGTSEKIAVEKINSMSFRDGSYGWLGAGIGAAVGTIVGILWVNSATSDDNSTESQIVGTVVSPGIAIGSVLVGTILGGVIGINIGKYDNYYFDKNEKDKEDKMKKILKVQR